MTIGGGVMEEGDEREESAIRIHLNLTGQICVADARLGNHVDLGLLEKGKLISGIFCNCLIERMKNLRFYQIKYIRYKINS